MKQKLLQVLTAVAAFFAAPLAAYAERFLVVFVNTQSQFITGRVPQPELNSSNLLSVRAEITPAAMGAGDVLEMLLMPVDAVVDDWVLDTDDIDTNGAPTITFDVGILNAGKTAVSAAAADGGAKWGTALTTAQAGGLARAATTAHTRVQPAAALRVIGLVAVGAAATFAAGKVGLTVKFRAKNQTI